LDVTVIQHLLQMFIAAMLTFIVFTFSSLLVAVQIASARLTPRIISTTLLRDRMRGYRGIPSSSKGRTMKSFFKATVIGGVLFLLPAALVLFILSYAVRLVAKIAQPISDGLGLDELGDAGGIGAATGLAILVLVVLSLGAGMIARTGGGRQISRWFEASLLGGLPQYQMLKSMVESVAQFETSTDIKPALVSIEDGWQIGYLLERLHDGWVAVFLPQAPTPMSGNVMYFPIARVRPLDMTMVQAMTLVKRIGIGSAAALHGADLRLPVA
jgi:uncharacterized membrane protein